MKTHNLKNLVTGERATVSARTVEAARAAAARMTREAGGYLAGQLWAVEVAS